MNLTTLINAATVIGAAQSTAKVARLLDNGDVVLGTARRISGDTEDVLHASLEVTTNQGMEVAWNVGVLAQEVATGEFVVNPDA